MRYELLSGPCLSVVVQMVSCCADRSVDSRGQSSAHTVCSQFPVVALRAQPGAVRPIGLPCGAGRDGAAAPSGQGSPCLPAWELWAAWCRDSNGMGMGSELCAWAADASAGFAGLFSALLTSFRSHRGGGELPCLGFQEGLFKQREVNVSWGCCCSVPPRPKVLHLGAAAIACGGAWQWICS